MDITRDIHSLTDFKKNTPIFLQQFKETGEPLILTINGKAELVVQDAESYQKLLQIVEGAKVFDGIRQSLEDVMARLTVSLEQLNRQVHAKHESSV